MICRASSHTLLGNISPERKSRALFGPLDTQHCGANLAGERLSLVCSAYPHLLGLRSL